MAQPDVSTIQANLRSGKWVGILPTDTIYGLVGSALSKKAVERIYKLRKRNKKKPFIILISSPEELRLFGVSPSKEVDSLLRRLWPAKASIILPCPNKRFLYLHRSRKSLAFRVPASRWLRNFLAVTGPLVAPSANLAGKPFAKTIKEARAYFGDKVDFYLSKGALRDRPSVILELKRG